MFHVNIALRGLEGLRPMLHVSCPFGLLVLRRFGLLIVLKIHPFIGFFPAFIGLSCYGLLGASTFVSSYNKNKLKMNRELTLLRTFAAAAGIGVAFLAMSAFTKAGNQKFGEIDVERINIIEKDGTVKMVITNVERFPNGNDSINNRPTNEDRKKRSGMLFFNEEGMECGGLIYDGRKTEKGHTSGLSLTYDQYDGDQVMQLLMQDDKEGNNRFVRSSIAFIDQPANATQAGISRIVKELNELAKTDRKAMQQKYQEYKKLGLAGPVDRMVLGQTKSRSNGLFLFDDKGMPRAMFFIDKENNAQLQFFDEKGNTIASFPEPKK